MGYGLIVPFIFCYLLIRVWILHGRKIPMIFAGLWVAAVFGFRMLKLPALASSLTVIFLAIILLLIDRYQSTLRAGM